MFARGNLRLQQLEEIKLKEIMLILMSGTYHSLRNCISRKSSTTKPAVR